MASQNQGRGGAGDGVQALTEMGRRLAFTKKLQAITNRIHAAQNIDEIITGLSEEICALLEADRITIYVMSDDGQWIVSKVKTGLDAFKDIRLPIGAQSIAGYAAATKTLLNIADVYDPEELRRLSPGLHFLPDVDKRTGYRAKQMLVAPIIDDGDELLGVVQLINTLSGLRFPRLADGDLMEIAKTLAIAFRQRKSAPPTPGLGKFEDLCRRGVLSVAELNLAMRAARRKNKILEDMLIDEFQVSPEDVGKALGAFYNVAYEPFRANRTKPDALLAGLKRVYVESNRWLPLEENAHGLMVLTTDPEGLKGGHAAEQIFPGRRLDYRVCSAREFAQTVQQFFGDELERGSIGLMVSALDAEREETEAAQDEQSAAADNELVRLVNRIITDAYEQGVSDIHVEPYGGKEKTAIRFRKDGTLVPYIELPPSVRNALVARIKIMCDLDISEKRKPQDGKIKFRRFGPLDIELRVATLPTAGGLEDVVLRILAAGKPKPVDALGLSPNNLKNIKTLVSRPYGLFLVCGPTGSGKTTTLHSVVGYINTPETKIWTAEDPVEITQRGLRQVQVNPKTGFTFAVAMRAFLRADPDVIMVGEMRDHETVATGVEASLTGHLVLSTLHTNSAPESIVRLLDMGMDPFNFADALLGILAQRLAKCLCPKCKRGHSASAAELERLAVEYCAELGSGAAAREAAQRAVLARWRESSGASGGEVTLFEPVGCDACNGTGYRGRMGLHELLVCSDPIKRHIQERARVAEILATALGEGMRTLKQDGIEKVLQGMTDMAQVRAVCVK
ncbi:MAG: ATPase, T2SS/T4P/T4SS family [Betaproteobacteria bacterium]|nr:ATPase, T2SS/T4P/T4SS family [Betaproteobacteria bacterium]